MGLKNILMTYKFPHDKEVQNTVNYYFCDVCHYCFEAESLPKRCPDCGKTDYQNRLAIRPATEKKYRIFSEPWMRNGNKPTDCLLWYPRRAVFISITNLYLHPYHFVIFSLTFFGTSIKPNR